MTLEVKNLYKSYEAHNVLNKVSFSLQKGDIVGFLGPNGAGKSTTMKIITGTLRPDKGELFIHNKKITEHTPEIQKKIGYLPENNPLYGDMYVVEYLSFIAGLHKITDKQKRVNTCLETVGIKSERTKKIEQLSKGYKQRVGIAAALLHDPEIIILDEPTSGLDPNQVLAIRNLIRELGKNKTVLFSTHILQEAEAICNKIIIINNGYIIADENITNIRTMSDKKNMIITLENALSETDFSPLNPYFTTITKRGQQWIFTTDSKENFTHAFMQLSIQNNWTIKSLNEENFSIEKLFTLLTKSSDQTI